MSDSVDPQDEWVPEFEGQRPPFGPGNSVGVRTQLQPGHELTLTHGAYSPRKVDPLAKELVDGLLADPAVDYLKAPAFRPAVWAWARAEARCQFVQEYLMKAGLVTGDGIGDLDSESVRAAHLLEQRVEARAATLRARLGLDPLSRARLGKDVAQGKAAGDMSILMAQQAKAEQDRRDKEAGR